MSIQWQIIQTLTHSLGRAVSDEVHNSTLTLNLTNSLWLHCAIYFPQGLVSALTVLNIILQSKRVAAKVAMHEHKNVLLVST